MIMKKYFNNSGMSILEIVIVIMIITLGMVGVSSLVIQNIQAQYINKNILIASSLAQEGLELVRNVRDENWLITDNGWDQDILGDGTYAIDYRGRSSINESVNLISDSGARLYINGDGFYIHNSIGGEATDFYRMITATSQDGYLDIKCTIRWNEGGRNHDYTAETYLYDWR